MSKTNEKLEALFEVAVALETEAQRAAYLNRACPDPELRREVESLLAAHQNPDSVFADKPVRAEAAQSDGVGTMIGRYNLLQRIGEGGCGVVYMAEQEEPVRRKVALKVIKLGMDTKQVIARFEAERQALALMDHPNIAKVLDAGAIGAPDSQLSTPNSQLPQGRPYFVMELVRGVKITEFCDEHNLSTADRLKLFIQVCQAIQHAHQKGIIHRDIKPSNILVTVNDGVPVPKVIDFGIAKATQGRLTDHTLFTAFEQFIGTPAYMSPEQAVMTSVDIDTRSDIYSLGVLLYELLTGKTPFDQKELLAAGLDAMRRIIRESEPVKPSTRLTQELAKVGEWESEKVGKATALAAESHSPIFPTAHFRPSPRREPRELQRLIPALRGDLDWIVMKCLEKDRLRRYESANGLAADLARHLNNEPVVARPPSRLYEFQKMVKRHKVGFAAGTAILVVLAGGIALTTWQAVRANRAERQHRVSQAEAEQARQTAQAESSRAAAAMESKKALSTSDFLQAVRLVDEDNANDALPYLARSLLINPTNDAALTRLATLLAYRTWMLPTVVLKHEKPVNSVEFSSDGKRLVTASQDGTARVWDAKTGQSLIEPMKHTASVASAQFSPDGKRIVTISRDIARVWDAQTGQLVTELNKDGGGVASAQSNPDGTMPPVPTLPPSDGALSAQFSPEGKRIVTVSRDKAVRVWDAQSGKLLTEPMKHTNVVASAQFSPDGKCIETISRDNTVRVWDAQTGQLLEEPGTHSSLSGTNQLSPDGTRKLEISSSRIVRVVDALTGQPVSEPMKHEAAVSMARFSPDGSRVVTAARDNTIRMWAAQTTPAGFLRSPYPNQGAVRYGQDVPQAEFSPDGRWLVMPSSQETLLVWDAQTAAPLARLTHDGEITAARFSPDGKRLVTGSRDHTAQVWDAQTGRRLGQPMKHGMMVFAAQFSPDGRHIVTASFDQTARVWNAQTGQPLTGPMTHGNALATADFTSDGKRILTVSQGTRMIPATGRLWDAQTGQPLADSIAIGTPEAGSVHSCFEGMRILTVSRRAKEPVPATLRVWDAQTGRPLTGPMTHGDVADLTSAEFSSDGKRILTVSKHGPRAIWARVPATFRVWDAQTGQPLTQPVTVGVPGVDSAQISPDGKRVATALGDMAQVWDAQTGKPLTEPMTTGTRADTASSARFSPDGKRILTTGGTARVWDVAPTQAPSPVWLFQIAEAISGKVLNKEGVLEPTRLNRFETLNQIRQKLSAQPDNDWVVWGRWLLADSATRTLSPFAKVTVPDYIERLIKEKTRQSLDEAEQLAAGRPEVLQRITESRETLRQPKK